MRDKLYSQWQCDRFGFGLKVLVFAVAALIYPDPRHLSQIMLSGLVVANLILLALATKPQRYLATVLRAANIARFVEFGVLAIVILSATRAVDHRPGQIPPDWLLAIPLVLIAAVVERNFRKPMIGAVSIGMATWYVGGHHLRIEEFVLVLNLTVVVAGAGLLSAFRVREELLRRRDLRMNILLTTSTAIGESDTSATVLKTLRSAVRDLGAEAGYVALVGEDDPDILEVEAAYGRQAAFTFPPKIAVGTGVSGYVAKMGQPVSIHASKNKSIDCDGLDLEVKAAVSVPLLARGSIQPGRASGEQMLGAITLAYTDSSEAIDRDDLDLLQSVGTLLATAISNQRMEAKQRTTFLRTLESLATALEARDDYTRGHSNRVCEVSLQLGQALGFGPEAIEELRIGTILHDIGKIGVPDEVLNKPGKLTDAEFETMKSHPVIGYDICRPLMLSEGVLMIIRNHHEKLDGRGYPDGLKGGELPLSLRIVCVADAFDAMSSRRPYRGVMDMEYVLGELSKGAGTQFDPVVVESLKGLILNGELDSVYHAFWQVKKEAA